MQQPRHLLRLTATHYFQKNNNNNKTNSMKKNSISKISFSKSTISNLTSLQQVKGGGSNFCNATKPAGTFVTILICDSLDSCL
jgi:hypothetical protein